jgi:hypothetical protein
MYKVYGIELSFTTVFLYIILIVLRFKLLYKEYGELYKKFATLFINFLFYN